MAEIRSFIAAAISPALITRLATVQQQLRHAGASVAWVRPEGMHLTLKFLGALPAERVPAIGDALEHVAGAFSSIDVSVDGAGAFPTLSRARVIWVGIGAGGDALCALAAAVDEATAALGFPREPRSFTPHLTLGRVKSPEGLDRLIPLVQALASEHFGTMTVRSIDLMRSDLAPAGARYTVLRRLPLAGPQPRIIE